MNDITFADIEKAATEIREALRETLLTYSPSVSELTDREVCFKWENRLRTGSFKERGALNFIHGLVEQGDRRGVCAASAGNHALALSYHAERYNLPCTIVMPENAPLIKYEQTRRHNANVILHGETFDDALRKARELTDRHNLAFVSAFDHPWIVAGQGTCGYELLHQLHEFDAVVVPVGGGGLIAGIATAIKAQRPETAVIGVQSEWSSYWKSAPEDRVKAPPRFTLADGIAIKTIGKFTAPIVERHVDELVTVSESEIANAVVRFLEFEKTVVEGAGAAGLAALLTGKIPDRYRSVVIVVSGSNIDTNLLSQLINRAMANRDRLVRVRVSVPDRFGSLHNITGVIARTGANILDVYHDRNFSDVPGYVDITFILEVRDKDHGEHVVVNLAEAGIPVRRL